SSNVIYEGTLQQTRLFDRNEQTYIDNMAAADKLARKLSLVKTRFKGKTNYYLQSDVNAAIVKEFLSEYRTAGGDKVDADKISNYIDLANENGELLQWTVAIVEGDAADRTGLGDYPVTLGNISLRSAVARGKKAEPPIN